ncbi:MAG: methyltransferase domain-containing protein [Chthoniobacterales bacterium]
MPNNATEPVYDYAVEDDLFEQIYPQEIRELSAIHWTPLTIARRAARLLVTRPGMRVLDIGCGVGKFCILGALTTRGHFTGVEQRKHLVDFACTAIQILKVPNARILHGNITETEFAEFDAFYLFNPFEENLFEAGKIDASVSLSLALYKQYVRYVAEQLALAPIGTRLVTYGGYCHEVPNCYDSRQKVSDEQLKLWVKTSESRGKAFCRESSMEQVEELLGMITNLGGLRAGTTPPRSNRRNAKPEITL